MLARTSTERAPWHILESVDKRYARIKAMRLVIGAIRQTQAGKGRLRAKAVGDLQRGCTAFFHKVSLYYKCTIVCQTDSINIPVLWQKVKSPLAVKRNAGQPADCPALR